MPQGILENNIINIGGFFTWFGVGFVKYWEYMKLEDVNNGLELLMVIGGLVFLFFKIQGIRLDNKKKKKDHWLLAKMKSAGDQAFIKRYSLPQGGAMLAHLQKKTKQLGGEMEGPAASALAELIGQDTRAAIHEIEKLLAYVNYARPISLQDVEDCALEIGEHGDYFGLMDALSSGPGAKAITHLRQLQAERDPISLFFGLVGQFRGLLAAREIVDQGGGKEQLAKRLGMHPFRALKLIAQCRKYDLASLEKIYQKLSEYDRQIKKGLIQPQLAMDFIVAAISA